MKQDKTSFKYKSLGINFEADMATKEKQLKDNAVAIPIKLAFDFSDKTGNPKTFYGDTAKCRYRYENVEINESKYKRCSIEPSFVITLTDTLRGKNSEVKNFVIILCEYENEKIQTLKQLLKKLNYRYTAISRVIKADKAFVIYNMPLKAGLTLAKHFIYGEKQSTGAKYSYILVDTGGGYQVSNVKENITTMSAAKNYFASCASGEFAIPFEFLE